MAIGLIGPAIAANEVGTHLSLYQGNCSGHNQNPHPSSTTFAANSPFHIEHGWVNSNLGFSGNSTNAAFLGPNTFFEVYLDGVQQLSVRDDSVSNGFYIKLFLTNYANGMTGTHTFLGQWYEDGTFLGQAPGPVFALACALTVSFQ